MAGTHDIRDIIVDNTIIKTEYFEHSVATGVLIVLISINEDKFINFSRSSYLPLDRNTSLNYTLPDDLTPGLYCVFAYDIESDGTLHNGVTYPASTKLLYVTGNSEGGVASSYFNNSNKFYSIDSHSQPSPSEDIENCTVTYFRSLISAMCSYSWFSRETGFQVIVQLNNITEVNRLLINRTTEHRQLTPVTVEVEENSTYHVTILSLEGNVVVHSDIIHSMDKLGVYEFQPRIYY